MRFAPFVLLAALPWPSAAWDTVPHRQVTRAALESLPSCSRERLGTEAAPLVEIYCLYPDRYLEMDRYGFVRGGPGPRSAREIRAYCVRPDGELVHGISGDRAYDRKSLDFLLTRIAAALRSNHTAEAAKYAGVLSHFISDSLSPPHAVSADELNRILPEPPFPVNLHSSIERSLPALTLRPSTAAWSNPDTILDQCYFEAARNLKDLPAMVKAVYAHDEAALDIYRLRAGTRAAEILAGAMASLLAQR